MLRITYSLNGSTKVEDFESEEAWNDFYESYNPSDSPFILEVLSKVKIN